MITIARAEGGQIRQAVCDFLCLNGLADGNALRIPFAVHLALYFLEIRHFHKDLCPPRPGRLPGKGQTFDRLRSDLWLPKVRPLVASPPRGAWDGFNVVAR